MSIYDSMTRVYVRQMIKNPRGRAYLLAQVADAEDNGEAAVFDQALAFVDDPQLQKMIRRHREDEIRHGQLFRARSKSTGFDPGPIPEELKVLVHIDRALDGFFSRPIRSASEVMLAYLILQVIEERAVNQFGLFIDLFERVDPESAQVFREVAQDEERHLKYCQAISLHYAPDRQTLDAELHRLRMIEATVFKKTMELSARYALDRGFLEGALVQAFWRGIGWLGAGSELLPMTQFAEVRA